MGCDSTFVKKRVAGTASSPTTADEFTLANIFSIITYFCARISLHDFDSESSLKKQKLFT